MNIDDAIKREKEIHKDNQMIAETHILYGDFTLEELYCDDTEVIEEHLGNYRFASEYHKHIAEWLEELKEARKGFEENRRAGYKRGYSDGYADAIDECVRIIEETVWRDTDMLVDNIREFAKGSEENE